MTTYAAAGRNLYLASDGPVRLVSSTKLPVIVVHGGAGDWKDDRIPIGLEHVTRAAKIGFRILESGGRALDAAEACTVYMEGCGKLNAGTGATRNLDNELELDAMIVDGSKLLSGAIMGAKGIMHPVSLARYAMERTNHTQFAGDGVQKLYRAMIAEGYRKEQSQGVTSTPFGIGSNDTVGCVAIDNRGSIACTSSTGGIHKKMSGRVGDSCIFGAGAYANKTAGATATGFGEHIIRVLLSRMVVMYIEQGLTPQEATSKGIDLLKRETGSEAGIVAADRNGEFGAYTNSKAMPMAVIQHGAGPLKTFSLRDEIVSI